MKRVTCLVLALFATVAHGQSFGTYIGRVVASWDANGRTMTLTEQFSYIDPTGVRWDAPAGSTVDGASIPQIAWSIIGGPFEGKYRDSSVIHDVACIEKRRSWETVHKAFHTGMLASGVDQTRAKVMYAAVYHFGPRWPTKAEVRYTASQSKEEQVCVQVLGGAPPVCITIPRATGPGEGVLRIELPSPPQTLSKEAFNRLSSQIEARETSLSPMSLEEIQVFQ